MYEINKEEQEKLEEAMKPLMKYLAENHHPHVTAIVTANKAEILEGIGVVNTDEFIVD